MTFRIKNLALAEEGKKKVDWAEVHMPVMTSLRKKLQKKQPLKDLKIAGCLHVTKETAVLIRTISALGANVAWCGCNPLSTQDDVAASIAETGVSIFASRGVSKKQYYDDIHSTMKFKPNITIDDGADLTVEMHNSHGKQSKEIYGGTEETTTGVIRLRAMEQAGKLKYPIIAVNDAETKHDFDNIYGTGQSALDGIIRATNILIAGKTIVVAGYGHVGKGVARRSLGLGAKVIVTEVDPIAGLKAKLDGYDVMPMKEASVLGDIIITTTGCNDVVTQEHILNLKNGAILANAGHFNVEISIPDLESNSISHKKITENNHEYLLKNRNKIYLIGEGRLVNLAAAEGHPSEVMDMSFANQLFSVLKLVDSKGTLSPRVYEIDKAQDQEIARAKLESIGVRIDVLSSDQRKYLQGFSIGT